MTTEKRLFPKQTLSRGKLEDRYVVRQGEGEKKLGGGGQVSILPAVMSGGVTHGWYKKRNLHEKKGKENCCAVRTKKRHQQGNSQGIDSYTSIIGGDPQGPRSSRPSMWSTDYGGPGRRQCVRVARKGATGGRKLPKERASSPVRKNRNNYWRGVRGDTGGSRNAIELYTNLSR